MVKLQSYVIYPQVVGNSCCSSFGKNMMREFVPYTPEMDRLSSDEKKDLVRAARSVKQFIISSAAISKVPYATRDAHSKTYAVVKGKLNIAEDLPDFVKEIFTRKEYEITARFSNANLVINKAGSDIPLYGFSLKIHGVAGADANFPLVNFPLFPTNSVSDFLKFFTSVNHYLVAKQDNFLVAAFDLPLLLARSVKLFGGLFSFDVLKKSAGYLSKRKNFFFNFKYSGIGCYRIGDYVMKLELRPQPVKEIKDKNTGNAVLDYLTHHDLDCDLILKMCSDREKQPINDLMKEWEDATEIVLGKITLPANHLLDPTAPETEQINFNPFYNPEILQPVGRMQQTRKKIYDISVRTRNLINQEPTQS